MKGKAGAAALGELMLLIARNEGVQTALARIEERQVPDALIGASEALQRFLEQYGTPVTPPKTSVRAKTSVTQVESVAPPPFPPPTPPSAPTAASTPAPTSAPAPKPIAVPAPATPPAPKPIAVPAPATPAAPKPMAAPAPATPAASKPIATPSPASTAASETIPAPSPTPIAANRPTPAPSPTSTAASRGASSSTPSSAGTSTAPPQPTAGRRERPELQTPPPEVQSEPSTPPAPTVLQRYESYQFEDQQSYVHAVSLIPLSDSPSPEPFIIDGRALDQRARMFAFDHAGMRFYMSELNPDVFSVSKNGMLLLNKTDSIRMRGMHEQIVNRLRLNGLVLPAEFGTAVLGKEDLARRVEFRLHALLELVLNLGKTMTWHCIVSVLDDKVQQRMGAEPASQRSGRHESERGRHAAPGKRTDVKALERLLTREKKIAESMLDTLASVADDHTIEHIVNLGSGRSEDWKSILAASFTLPPSRQREFFRAMVDMETDHAMIEPMVRVTGTTECFSLLM